MRKLIELAFLSASLDTKSAGYFSTLNSRTAPSRISRLVELIQKGEIYDDAGACQFLYGDSDLVSSTTYNSAKMRLFGRLKDSVLHYHEKKMFSMSLSQAEYSCIKNAAIVRVLLMKGAAHSAEFLAKKYYVIASESQFPLEASIFAQALSAVESMRGQRQRCEKYASLQQYWSDVHQAESQSRAAVDLVMSWYAAQWTPQLSHLPFLDQNIRRTDTWRKKYDTNELHLDYFRLQRVRAELQQDYKRIIALLVEVEEYYETHPRFRSRLILAAFTTAALAANIWLNKLDDAFECAERCNQLLTRGKYNWYVFQEYYLILALRARNYKLAASVFRQSVTQLQKAHKEGITLEKWRLFEYYIRFVWRTDLKETLLPRTVVENPTHDKSYHAFVNSIPTISKDLSGYGIAAVFAQVLTLLRARDFDALILRDESLQTYRRKRLTKLNYRLAIFAKLIHLIVVCEFDAKTIKRRSAPLLKSLSNVPPQYGRGTAETLEIIPLEDLWELMMEEL